MGFSNKPSRRLVGLRVRVFLQVAPVWIQDLVWGGKRGQRGLWARRKDKRCEHSERTGVVLVWRVNGDVVGLRCLCLEWR